MANGVNYLVVEMVDRNNVIDGGTPWTNGPLVIGGVKELRNDIVEFGGADIIETIGSEERIDLTQTK